MRRLCIDCGNNKDKAERLYNLLSNDTTRHADIQEWHIEDVVFWLVGYFTKGQGKTV